MYFKKCMLYNTIKLAVARKQYFSESLKNNGSRISQQQVKYSGQWVISKGRKLASIVILDLDDDENPIDMSYLVYY